MFEILKIKLLLRKFNEDNKPDTIPELAAEIEKRILPEPIIQKALSLIFTYGSDVYFQQVFSNHMISQETKWTASFKILTGFGCSTFKKWISTSSKNHLTSRYIINMWENNFNFKDTSPENIDLLVNYGPRDQNCIQGILLKILKQSVPPSRHEMEYLYDRFGETEFSEVLWSEWLKSTVSIKKIQTRIPEKIILSLFSNRRLGTGSYNLLLLAQQRGLIGKENWEEITNSKNTEETLFFVEMSPENIFKKYIKNLLFREFDENTNFIINQRLRHTDFP